MPQSTHSQQWACAKDFFARKEEVPICELKNIRIGFAEQTPGVFKQTNAYNYLHMGYKQHSVGLHH